MPRNIAMVISYDGTDFSGWQIQKKDKSVQGTIEKALEDLHGQPISLTGAGRTDAGVHATGYVGNFYSSKENIDAARFRDALNSRLPRDIRILRSTQVPNSFHSRRNALARHYEYRIIPGSAAVAHMNRFAWFIRRIPPLSLLNNMAQTICGRHDFTTFCVAKDKSHDRIRRIHHAVFLPDGPGILFRIKGNAFLWNMVRSLLGTMVDLGLRGESAERMGALLKSQDRSQAGPTAPAQGLFLSKVDYGPDAAIY